MSAQNMSRKRPAPGAEPLAYPQQTAQPTQAYNAAIGPQLSDDQFLQWGQTAQNPYQDTSMYSNISTQPSYAPNNVPPSNQLTRRPMNQIATRPSMNGTSWLPEPASATSATGDGAWEDDVDELEAKAQVAKRDAQAKRKAIPPFVLKLRSFLDDGKNGDLIRWTIDGKSFVVLDEDEFAKKLIPELFKHNNYASFVRQLNMYGFHKKVGLSDNSMRASERKSKSPSEYSNPYFREGHPDLMWLIQKPKNVTTSAKGKSRTKSEGENQDDGDDGAEEVPADTRSRVRPQLTLGDTENSMNVETLQSVQRELSAIRHQQAQISKMIGALKREHEQLYGQAATFQDQHTRHENSINAILTFLATVYNRSLSGQESGPNIAGLFGNNLPQNQSGSVVDVGDYTFNQFPGVDEVNNRPLKRQPLLLTDGQTRAQTMSPASNSSPQLRQARRTSQMPRQSQSPNVRVEEVQDLNDMPHQPVQSGSRLQPPSHDSGQLRHSPGTSGQRQQDMMSMIQNANAQNLSPSTPVADFANVLNDLENSRGNTPLSTTQRDRVLQMINNSAKQTGDNALINTTPPSGPLNFDRRLAHTQSELDALAKMQAQQDQSVEKLTNLLQPLSPSGSIPGIGDGQNLPPPPMDIDDFLNHNEYFGDLPVDGNEFDFGNNGTSAGHAFNWDNANDDGDDDELFADVSGNNNELFGVGGGKYSSGPNFGIGNDHGNDGVKKVESLASSEAGTPKHSSVGGVDGVDDSRGRTLRTIDEEPAGKKQRRS